MTRINIALDASADAQGLAQLHQECFADGWDAEGFAQMLKVEGTFCLGAEAESQLAGFLLFRALFAEAEILTLCVAPGLRRRGMATSLLAALKDWCRAHEVASVWLETRESTLALYAQAGFKAVSRRKGYYQSMDAAEDALVMRLLP
jgi:ribosomal-protein-alanine N-acetyltransferase